MKNSKLHKLYELLTAKEKRKFTRWLTAELNGKKAKLLILKEGLDKKEEREEVWKRLYPGKTYNDEKLRSQMKLLNEYVEEFFAILSFRKQRAQRDLFLAIEVFMRKESDLFTTVLNKARRRLNTQNLRSDQYYQFKYEYDLLAHQFGIHGGKKNAGELAGQLNDSLDSMIIINKLKVALMNQSYKAKNKQLPTRFIEAVSEILKSDPKFAKEPLLQMYFQVYSLATGAKLEDADKLRKSFKEYGESLALSDYRIIFEMLLNFYIRRINKYVEPLFEIMSELYLGAIKREVLLVNGVISPQHITNLIRIALKEKKYEKARVHLEQLLPKVAPNIRNDFRIYNEAYIFFAEKKYRQAFNLINQKTLFKNQWMETNFRFLLLKCWYELDITIELSDIHNVSRVLNRRDEISKSKDTFFRKTLKYFKELIRAFSDEDFQKLKEKINEELFFPEKSWILEKIDEKIPN